MNVIRHHVTITQTLVFGANFDRTINVPFIPDEVRVKQIAYSGSVADTLLYEVHIDSICPTAALGSFLGVGVVSFVGSTFTLNRPIMGTHTIRVTSEGLPSIVPGSQLNIHLEFRKYK